MPSCLVGTLLDFRGEGVTIMEVDDVRRVEGRDKRERKLAYARAKGFVGKPGWDEINQRFAGCPIVEIKL